MLPISCAGCGKEIRVREELAGKRVKCPECGDQVPVPRAKGKPTAITANSRSLAARRRDENEECNDEEIPWRGRKQEEKSSALPLVLGIGAAVFVLLLLVGGVVGYVIYRASSAKDTMQQV